MSWMWAVGFLLAAAVSYALALWHACRGSASARVRLGDERVDLQPRDEAKGFERRVLADGSLLVPKGFRVDADAPGRSTLTLERKATIQVTVQPRRSRSFLTRTDGRRLLESALTARWSYAGVVMRKALVRGQTDISFARVTLGPLSLAERGRPRSLRWARAEPDTHLRGFLRRGLQHFRGEASTARVRQVDLFDDERHYRVDFVSFRDALSEEQALICVASFVPAVVKETALASRIPSA